MPIPFRTPLHDNDFGRIARVLPIYWENGMKAYLVVTVNSGKSRDVARVISALPGVIMADACWGVGDVFAVLEFSSWSDLNHVVLEKIHQTPNVTHTETHVAIQE